MEVSKPLAPSKVQLVKASTNSLEVSWTPSPSAQYYILQIQKIDIPTGTSNTNLPNPVPLKTAPVSSDLTQAQLSNVQMVNHLRPHNKQTLVCSQVGQQKSVGSPVVLQNKYPANTNSRIFGNSNIVRIRSPSNVANSKSDAIVAAGGNLATGIAVQPMTLKSDTMVSAMSTASTYTIANTNIANISTTIASSTSGQSLASMSGLASLAAAAAVTNKIGTNNIPMIPIQGSNSNVSLKMKTINPQQIRLTGSPTGATIVRAGAPGQATKQIILQKSANGQQVLQLVKTNQGVVTLPGKIVNNPAQQTLKSNENATIYRFLNPTNAKLIKGTNFVAVSRVPNITGKSAIMIAKPGTGVVNTNRLVVVTTASVAKPFQSTPTVQVNSSQPVTLTTPVNVAPLTTTGHLVGNQQIKMIVVSTGQVSGGTTGKPLTITVAGQGGIPKTVTIAAKPGQQIFNTGKGQVVIPGIQKSGAEGVTFSNNRPVTLQMAGSKTIAVMPSSIPVVCSSSDSPNEVGSKLSSPKQPSTTLVSTSDGPATTDAALAALAAEAGLIDPIHDISSGTISFMMSPDAAAVASVVKSDDNFTDVTLQASETEATKVEAESSTIPQMDGQMDCIFSDDDGDFAMADNEIHENPENDDIAENNENVIQADQDAIDTADNVSNEISQENMGENFDFPMSDEYQPSKLSDSTGDDAPGVSKTDQPEEEKEQDVSKDEKDYFAYSNEDGDKLTDNKEDMSDLKRKSPATSQDPLESSTNVLNLELEQNLDDAKKSVTEDEGPSQAKIPKTETTEKEILPETCDDADEDISKTIKEEENVVQKHAENLGDLSADAENAEQKIDSGLPLNECLNEDMENSLKSSNISSSPKLESKDEKKPEEFCDSKQDPETNLEKIDDQPISKQDDTPAEKKPDFKSEQGIAMDYEQAEKLNSPVFIEPFSHKVQKSSSASFEYEEPIKEEPTPELTQAVDETRKEDLDKLRIEKSMSIALTTLATAALGSSDHKVAPKTQQIVSTNLIT